MKIFLSTVILATLAVGGISLWADPAGRWHRDREFSHRPLTPDEAWIPSTPGWDERALKLAHLRQIERPEVVVLGSSRAMQVGSSYFAPGTRAFNLGVSGSSAEDLVAFWQVMKSHGKTPSRRLIVLVDPWVLNLNSGQYRWQSLGETVNEFMAQRNGERPGSLVAGRVALAFDELSDLLSYSTFSSGLKLLASGESSAPGGRVYPLDQVPPDKPGYRADGSYIYPAASLQPKSVEEIRKVASDYALGGRGVYGLDDWSESPKAISYLEALFADIQRAGLPTLVILPPYQPTAYRGILGRLGYRSIFPEFVARFRKLVPEGPSFSFCDALDPAKSGCGETEFLDGMHPLRSCEEKYLARCLKLVKD